MRRALPGGAPETLRGRDGALGCGGAVGGGGGGCGTRWRRAMRWKATTGGSDSFGSLGCLMALWNALSHMPLFVLLPAFRPLPPPVPWSGTEADWDEWRRATRVLLQRVHPVPVIRGWVREITASQPVARTERRVAECACALWAMLEASPEVLAMEDVLVGAFKLYIATGAVETRESICNTPAGLGIAVPALLEALRWRYPGETSACRCWQLHWSEGASLPLLHSLFAPLWRGGMVQARQAYTWFPSWDKFPLWRLIIVEGYVPGVVSAGPGHMVGVNCRGHIFCSRLGTLQDRDVYAATDVVLGRVGRVWQVWYVLLPGPHVAGTRPRVTGGAGFPSWHWRVGQERLWRVIYTVLTDWRQHRSPVRGFVDSF